MPSTAVLPDIETSIVCRNPSQSPVGGVSFAGGRKESDGTPKHVMRIFGRYALVLTVRGRARYLDTNGVNEIVSAGDLIVVFPELGHTYSPLSGERWDEFYIVFDGPVFDAWRRAGLLSPAKPILHVEPVAFWLRKMIAAAGEGHGGDPRAALAEAMRLQDLLVDILTAQSVRATVPVADSDWLSAARKILQRTDAPTDAKAAEELGVAYDTFRQKFARLAGMTPARYRTTQQIERACELLGDASLPLRAVADRCGFCDAFHFSKRFKQIMGVSPTDFRKRLSQ